MTTEEEIWVDSWHSPNIYEVSNFGKIRNKLTNKLLKPFMGKKGYPAIHLIVNGKRKRIDMHRLIYFSFYPHTNIKLVVHHIDHNKLNFNLNNLKALNHIIHSYMHAKLDGRKPPICKTRGKDHPSWKGRIISIDPISNKIKHILYGHTDMLSQGFFSSMVYRSIHHNKQYKKLLFKRISNNLNVEIDQIIDINNI